jgi:glycine betaine/proline transport system substrate-binding protein
MLLLQRFWKPTAIFLALLILPLVAMACGEDEEKPVIKFADQQFESLWINNAIAQFIIKNGYGYPVESIEMTTPIMQATLANGDIDVALELWQQNFLENYNEEIAKGCYVNLGPTYEGGPQFFAIPSYVHDQYGINTVFDMKEHWELFKDPEDPSKGAFINCIIGWQCAEINMVKMEAYGLTEMYNVISPGAAAAMDAAMAGAQKKTEPVFGYYWAPTSLMGAYDWWILEEPAYNAETWAKIAAAQVDKSLRPLSEAVAYETLPVDKGVHKTLNDKAPDIYEFLSKMNIGLEPINKTAAWAVETDIQVEWDKAAIYYLQNFEDRWSSWMPDKEFKKVKEALEDAS